MQTKFSDGSVMACGIVTKDPELKHVGSKSQAMTTFGIAVGKNSDDSTIYVNCKAWRSIAEYAAKMHKGDSAVVIGQIETSEYNGKTYKTLVVTWMNFISASSANQPTPPAQPRHNAGGDGEDELPF